MKKCLSYYEVLGNLYNHFQKKNLLIIFELKITVINSLSFSLSNELLSFDINLPTHFGFLILSSLMSLSLFLILSSSEINF